MRRQAEWKVDTHIRSARVPTSSTTRRRISSAALLVKVMARISHGAASPVASRWAMRRVSTRVLPEPAPATTSSGPPRCSTAARWGGFRSSTSRSTELLRAAARSSWTYSSPSKCSRARGRTARRPAAVGRRLVVGLEVVVGQMGRSRRGVVGRDVGGGPSVRRSRRGGRRVVVEREQLVVTEALARAHSHSMVPGGFDVTSSATRFTPSTSLMMREAIRSTRS